ncbi:AraC family ligand binding domain-containing protein, partial [Alistipes senegalensis]
MEESHVKYLMSNDQDMLWGMVVTTAGHQNIPPQAEYPSRNHPTRYLFSTEKGRVLNEYQLVYITRGRGQFVSTRQKECEIREGDMFLLFPGEWHNYRPDPHTGWHESWVGFTGPDIEKRVAARFFVREKAVFSIGIHEEIYHLYRWAATVAQQQ